MPAAAKSRSERFFGNVVWSWVGMATNLVMAVVISPYIVRKLGDEGYGVWALVLGLIDYYWLLDFGFRSATLKYSAQYRAENRPEKINEIVNTALAYAALVGLAMALISLSLPDGILSFFQISASYERIFMRVLKVIGMGWAIGIVFNMFGACLEGLQRFDITNKIYVGSNFLRAVGCMAALAAGYGLVEMSVVVVVCQLLGYIASYLALRKVFPEWRLSAALVKWPVMRQMLRYGANTFVAVIGMRSLLQAPPLLIGHYLPPAFIGYFGLPNRLLQYASDFVSRVALVTGSTASELSVEGNTGALNRLGVYINRYSLVIFMPLAILFLGYGEAIIRAWISPEFAARSAPLLPAFTLGVGLTSAAQYNSVSILYGIGKHGWYARTLLFEAAGTVAALIFVVPRYGILGAAWTVSILMIANRGLVTPMLLCWNLKVSVTKYLSGIFVRPLAAAIPAAALVWLMKYCGLRGGSIAQLFAIAAAVGTLYYAAAFFTCIRPEHRSAMFNWAARLRSMGMARLAAR